MILRIGHVKLNLHLAQPRCFYTRGTSRSYQRYNVLFCGSDEFSIASLKALRSATDLYESIHVLTPGESTVGRGGKKLGAAQKRGSLAPLLNYAREHDLPHTKMSELLAQASPAGNSEDWLPPSPFDHPSPSNLLLTASFGYIIPIPFLKLFAPEQRLNVHPSLLPRYRGAAPIQWTIANADETTGVTVQRLVEKGKGIDAGEIVGQVGDIRVPENATYENFTPSLAETGGNLLVKVLREMQSGTVSKNSSTGAIVYIVQAIATEQDESQKSRAPKINKEMAHIRWSSHSALRLDAIYRAIGYHTQNPLWTQLNGISIQLIDVKRDLSNYTPPDHVSANVRPGVAILDGSEPGKSEKRLMVACAANDGSDVQAKHGDVTWLEVRSVKPSGKSIMSVKDWWNGVRKSKQEVIFE